MRIVICAALALCLAGCNFVGQMADMAVQANQLNDALKKDFGDGVRTDLRVTNGDLSATITIESSQLRNVTVGEIERKAKQHVAAIVKKPAELYVVIHAPAQ
jgi:hypothetical protein